MWGAKGRGGNIGNRGGYSYGKYSMQKNAAIYVVVGQYGTTHKSGNGSMESQAAYNGGGYGQCGGGGATHIATNNRGVLSNYKNYQSEVLIVAGGGGGSEGGDDVGAGGGTNGGNGSKNYPTSHPMTKAPTGGTQTSGGTAGESTEGKAYAGSFGQGGHGTLQAKPMSDAGGGGGGGGGGWYGGGGQTYAGTGGGGSGHLGSSLISGTTGMQSGVNLSGNGKALISWMPVL